MDPKATVKVMRNSALEQQVESWLVEGLHPTDNQRLASVTSFRVRYLGCFSCEAALFFVILHRLKGTNGQRVN